MAPGRSPRLDEVVASWRRDFFDTEAIRPDDVDELCDHFREVVTARLDAGDSMGEAADVARSQLGTPGQLTREMSRAQRPPRYYRRWCVALALYAVAHAMLILTRVAGLGISAYRTGITLPADTPAVYEISAISILAGVSLVALIALRFDLKSAGRSMVKARSTFASIAPVVGLGVVLLLSLMFTDYWQWWLQAGSRSLPDPWGSVPWVLLIGMGGPMMALTVATMLQSHPALQIP